MAFDSFQEFLNMGGHGLYVWLAYGLGVLVLMGCVWVPVAQGRILRRTLARRLRREGGQA